MSQTIEQNTLPAVMQNKLQSVRWRRAGLVLSRAIAIAVVVLICGMVLAMAADWWFTLHNTTIRTVMTATCLTFVCAALVFTCTKPLIAAFRWKIAAKNVDNQIPQLEERWTTVANFATSAHQPDSVTSKAMLHQVTSEAVAMESLVKPSKVVRPTSLKSAAMALGAATLLLALFMASHWGQTSILLKRFWSPTTNITATQLISETRDQIVPRGDALNIVTRLSGVPRDTAKVVLDIGEFDPEEIILAPDEEHSDAFICRLDVDESFRYQVYSGDGRTEWYSVTAIDYPELSDVRLKVTPPEYVDRDPFEKTLIPGRIRAIYGSQLKLEMRPNAALATFELQLTSGVGDNAQAETLIMQPDDDGWYRYETQITDDFSLMPLLLSQHNLANEDRRVCNVHVIADQAPVARIISPTDELAVSATDVLDIKFEAHDDHGIATAELIVYDETDRKEGEEPSVLMVKEIPLGDQQLAKHIMGLTKLDMKELGLEDGQTISYAVRVTDNREVNLDPKDVEQQRALAAKQNGATKDSGDRSKSTTGRDSQQAGEEDAKLANGPQKPSKDGEKQRQQRGDQQKLATEDMLADATDAVDARNAELQQQMLKAAESKKNGRSSSPLALSEEREEPHPAGNRPVGSENETKVGDFGKSKDSKSDSKDSKLSTGEKDTPSDDKSDEDGESDSRESRPRVAVVSDESKAAAQSNQNDKSSNEIDSTKPTSGDTKEENDARPSEGNAQRNNKQGKDSSAESNGGSSSSKPEKEADSEDSRKDQDGEKHKMPPSPIAMKRMSGQSSESGQKKETKRRTVKVSERLAAIAAATQRKAADGAYRQKLIELDELLAVVEKQLNDLLKGVNQDFTLSEQFRKMDDQLGDVEQVISDFRDETRETEFVFVGQQLLFIKRTHVTPARDFVFAAIKEPDAAAESFASDSRHHVMTAREQLQALIKKYDRVQRDRKYKEKLDEAITIYEVYVEKAQPLMRESRQGAKDPFRRKIAIIETDQTYLDRAAEVAKLRRELMDEIGRLLADDPRLLSKFNEGIKRRRSSLWQQFTDLHDRQDEMFQEVSGWVRVDEGQRENLWILFAELRLHNAADLVRDAVELAERMESHIPLVLNASRGTAALTVKLAKQIALDARQCSLDAEQILKDGGDTSRVRNLTENAIRLNYQLSELEAALDQMAFENPDSEEVNGFVDLRQAETRVLADAADAWSESAASIQTQAFHKMAYVDQQEATIATELLRIDMQSIETDLVPQFAQAEAGMPLELSNMTRDLLRLVEAITFNQQCAAFSLKQNNMERAANQQELALEKFEKAESLFKRLRRKTADALDELPVQNPNIADLRDPTLDEFLAQLEREPNVEAQLGIPRRRSNLRRRQIALAWQSGGGGGGNGDEGEGTGLNGSARAAAERIRREMQTLAAGKKTNKPKEREMTKEEKEKQIAQAETMKKMIEQAAEQAKQQGDNPNSTPEQRQQAQAQAEKMQQMLQQLKNGQIPNDLWNQIAEAEETRGMMEALANGEAIPDEQWNKLRSTLDDGIGQANRRTPPEDYLPAIDHYQDAIRQIAPMTVE